MLFAIKKNKAVSLLELLITIAILAIGITVILQAISFSARVTGLANDMQRAVYLATDKLQELEFKESQGLIIKEPPQVEGVEGKFNWKYGLALDTNLNLFKLNLAIDWKRMSRKEEISINTYLR